MKTALLGQEIVLQKNTFKALSLQRHKASFLPDHWRCPRQPTHLFTPLCKAVHWFVWRSPWCHCAPLRKVADVVAKCLPAFFMVDLTHFDTIFNDDPIS